MPDLFVFALLLPVLLHGATLFLLFQRLMQVPFRYQNYRITPVNEFPSERRSMFGPTLKQLMAIGFKPYTGCTISKFIHLENTIDHGILLVHAESNTFALVEIRYPADGNDPTVTTFYNYFADGTWLITLNGSVHSLIGDFPHAVVGDAYAGSIATHWQFHAAKLAPLLDAGPSESLTSEQMVAALQHHGQQYVDGLVADRALLPQAENWFLSWRAALATAIKIRLGAGSNSQRQTTRQKLLLNHPEWVQEIPIGLQMESFQRLRAMEAKPRALRWGKWILLLTLGLFVLGTIALPQSFGQFDMTNLLSLVTVLFLHEAGHFGAMKAFGYRDTTMFFLPLFGAAVTGKKDDASLTEKVWVLLAGPLPGIVLGFGLMVGIQFNPSWIGLNHFATMMIGLNLLNLLPIYPLDGGKIAHHLLFSRYPFTDVLFKGLTVLMFGLMATISPTLLALAIVTAISIPASYRIARLNQTLQAEMPNPSSESMLELIFRQMTQAGYHKLPASQRDAMVKAILERQRENHAPLQSRLGLAGIYGLSLCLSLGGVVTALVAPSLINLNAPVTRSADAQTVNRSVDR
jgi:Zn-dependent protease